MRTLGLDFRVIPPDDHVERSKGTPFVRPSAFVKYMAVSKAESVMPKVPRGIIIGADTIIYFNGRIIQKPRNLKEAFLILRKLAGRKHTVYTGVALFDAGTGLFASCYEKTHVWLKKLTGPDIRKYFLAVDPIDKAGAYAIQEHGSMVVLGILGERDNVVGLPRKLLNKMIKEFERCKKK